MCTVYGVDSHDIYTHSLAGSLIKQVAFELVDLVRFYFLFLRAQTSAFSLCQILWLVIQANRYRNEANKEQK